jgi:hypothetical protein
MNMPFVFTAQPQSRISSLEIDKSCWHEFLALVVAVRVQLLACSQPLFH